MNKIKLLGLATGMTLVAACIAFGGNLVQSLISQQEYQLEDSALAVTNTARYFPAQLVGYSVSYEFAVTNLLDVSVTRVDAATDSQVDTFWTNTVNLLQVSHTNSAPALESGAVTSTLWIEEDDSIVITNSVSTNLILNLYWTY